MRPGQFIELTLSGRDFKIKKFTPETACFWAFKLLGDLAFSSGEELVSQLKSFMRQMQRAEFRTLQADCLSHVLITMDSGTHPLLGEMGLAVNDLPNDAIFELTIAALSFSMRDFFAQDRIQAIMGHVVGMFLPPTGPANSSASQSGENTGDSVKPSTEPIAFQTFST